MEGDRYTTNNLKLDSVETGDPTLTATNSNESNLVGTCTETALTLELLTSMHTLPPSHSLHRCLRKRE